MSVYPHTVITESCTCIVCGSYFFRTVNVYQSTAQYVLPVGTVTNPTVSSTTYEYQVADDKNNILCQECLRFIRDLISREKTQNFGF